MAATRRPKTAKPPADKAEPVQATLTANDRKPPAASRGRDTEIDQCLLEAFLMGTTVKEAARLAGVSESTAQRRRSDKAFMKRYRESQATMQQRSLQLLTASGPIGIQALARLAAGGFERLVHPVTKEVVWSHIPYTAQIQAAQKLTELAVGSLARVQVTIDADVDRSEVVDRTKVRLQAYADEARKLLEEHAPIDTTATEATVTGSVPVVAVERRRRQG